ncbi:MAG: prolipoprotein diacylglyceryl transferase [Mycobacteriales bacterium]
MPASGSVLNLASFPSPARSVWYLGPIPLRAYALCIIAGIVAAIWITQKRWVARGGRPGTVSDVAVWAVVFGLVGGRLYHVVTDNELYFRAGRDPWRAFAVWEGGLGIWGAIALGGVGAWIGCRRAGIRLPPFADAAAPGIAVAHAIGRWGNYFNQELFGRPTGLPWAVEIDPDQPNAVAGATTYHPTFLYESLWCLALAGVLVLVDRRFRLGHGRLFALYVMGYTAGRVWIELLRIDTANHVLGLRLNVWTSILVFAGGLLYFLLVRGPRETEVQPGPPAADGTVAAPDPDRTDDPDDTVAMDAPNVEDAGDRSASAVPAAPDGDRRGGDGETVRDTGAARRP